MKIGYARVSTSSQNLDRQIDALEERGCDRIYSEKISGAAKEKPELEAALDALREGDTFVLTRLKRLGRELKDLVTKGERITHEIGADLIFVEQEHLHLDTPQARLNYHIFGALAQFEREMINEKVQEGLESARQRGQIGGRPPALQPSDVKQIATLMGNREENGLTVQGIAEQFGVSDSLIYQYVGPNGDIRKMPDED
jgi:Site-specific recombinases, DNA invertase Pin homologs